MYRLSHYTSRAGLEGIAETQTLWATHMLDVSDTSEYFFAWHAIQKAAMDYAIDMVPDDIKRPEFVLDHTADGATRNFKEWIKTTGDYGLLYMTSFARSRNHEEEQRGIRTLWEIYTKHAGYCLQFDLEDVKNMVHLDSLKGSYEQIAVERVTYGIDETAQDFKELRFQLGEQFLMMIARASRDRRIKLQYQEQWPQSALARQVYNFCGKHKDPCYVDEREFRILAYPAEQTGTVFMSGITTPKMIRKTETGKRYITLGEHWRPGIYPRRIIIGTKADPNIEAIVKQFNPRPEVAFANLPIA
jgi:hypothetical protein